MNETDGKWYFREKYLNDNHEIAYRVHPEGYDQMEDALRNSVNALNEFAAEMKELRKQVKELFHSQRNYKIGIMILFHLIQQTLMRF